MSASASITPTRPASRGEVSNYLDAALHQKRVENFSLCKALQMVSSRNVTGPEGEFSREERIRRQAFGRGALDFGPAGISIPDEVFRRGQRDLSTSEPTAGGMLVGEQIVGILPVLLNESVMFRAGATELSGLQSDATLTYGVTAPSTQWTTEGQAPSPASPDFGVAVASAKQVSTTITVSRQLLIQGGPAAEAFLNRMLGLALAQAVDEACLIGEGGAEPLGILNTASIPSTVTFGAAATYAKILEFETDADTALAPYAGRAYIGGISSKAKLKALQKFTGGGRAVWEDGRMNDYPAHSTGAIADERMIFGAFSDAFVCSWGIDLAPNKFTNATSGMVSLTATMWADLVLRPQSFVISTDSAAQ